MTDNIKPQTAYLNQCMFDRNGAHSLAIYKMFGISKCVIATAFYSYAQLI